MPIAFAVAFARDDGRWAACDEAIVRTLGHGYTGLLRGLDALITAPFGARVQWASMACAGGLGVMTFAMGQRLVRELGSKWLGLVIALAGAALATLTLPVQREATLAFGNVLGAVLVLLPVVLASSGVARAGVFAALGLALTYDLPVAITATLSLCALLAIAPEARLRADTPKGLRPEARLRADTPKGLGPEARLRADTPKGLRPEARLRADTPKGLRPEARLRADTPKGLRPEARSSIVPRPWRAHPLAMAWMLVGLLPVAWMAWRRTVAPEAALEVAPFAGLLGESTHSVSHTALAIARSELGIVALGFAAIGVASSLRSRVSRPLSGALCVVVVCGALAPAPSGPLRYSSTLLAGLAATSTLAACGMAAVAAFVAKAKIPFARASATMIVLLELAIPVRVADDTSLAEAKLPRDPTTAWNAWVFGELPRGALLLVPTARLLLRARSAAAVGALRDDVIVVPTFGLGSRATSRALGREPLLGPVVRDLALYGAPEELSLSQLAATRPVLVAFDMRWDKLFARHLVPHGAFDRYFVEPRGAIERLKAFASIDEPAMRIFAVNAPLADATRDLFRARAVAATAAGEREYADAAVTELQRVAPNDRLATELKRRGSAPHGTVDVRDLANRSWD
jgi:hypothetical protein